MIEEKIREYVRKNALQIKSFSVDRLFTGEITTYERKDLGPKGYKVVEHTFKDFDALKKHYGSKSKVKTEEPIKRVRRSVKADSRTTKKPMAKS